MAQRRKPSTYDRRLASVAARVGRARGTKPVSRGVAKQVEKYRRNFRSSKLYDTYRRSFAIQEAIRTGKLPTLKTVENNPEFWEQIDVIASITGRTSKGPNSPTAKALVRLGIRDEAAKYEVGNSPDAGVRTSKRRGSRTHKARTKTSSGGKPGRHS